MNTMYFTCSTLLTTMRVLSCERNRSEKNNTIVKQSCKGCSKWETETTDPLNLKTQEEILNPVQVQAEIPVAPRFNRHGDLVRIFNLHIGHVPRKVIDKRGLELK
jgi:hypothetical protein